MIILQFPSAEDRINEGEPGFRIVPHRHSDRTIQFNDRRGMGLKQQIVERDDVAPICRISGRSLGMGRCDCSLNGVGADLTDRQGVLYERDSFRNLVPVPQRSILIFQEN
jgi:hypothetical protein